MAITIEAYNVFRKALLDGDIDLVNDTLKLALCTGTYSPDIDADLDYGDITNEVANGSGYVTGGAAVTGGALNQDDSGDSGEFDIDDVVWSSASFTAAKAVLYDTTVSNKLICYIDFDGDQVGDGGNFTVAINASGILSIGE